MEKERLKLPPNREQRRRHQQYAAQDIYKSILDELRPGARNQYMWLWVVPIVAHRIKG